MKLIFITREGYDLAGARIRCYNFARELRKLGINTEVLSFADNLGAKSGKEEYKLRVRDKLRYNMEAFERLKGEKNTIFFLNRFNYHSFTPWLLRLINKNRLILDLDDWEIRENPRYYFGFWPSSKAEFFIRRIARNANFCIAASHFLKDFMAKFNSRIYYIPSGVDTDLFKPVENKRNDGKIIFSWIGTMHRKDDIENIEFAIDCFLELRKRYDNIYLELVGDGIYSDYLEKILEKVADKNISLRDWIYPGRVPDYLSTIDIGLVPLIQDTKFNKAKSPTKLFEYMAMAKPVVCSEIGECSYIIRDGENGFLAIDKKNFITKMDALVCNKELHGTFGGNARADIHKEYSLNKIGRTLHGALCETDS